MDRVVIREAYARITAAEPGAPDLKGLQCDLLRGGGAPCPYPPPEAAAMLKGEEEGAVFF